MPDSPGIRLRARGDGQFAARLPALRAASRGIFSQRLAPFTPPHQSREDRKVLLKALEVVSEHAARESVWLVLERSSVSGSKHARSAGSPAWRINSLNSRIMAGLDAAIR